MGLLQTKMHGFITPHLVDKLLFYKSNVPIRYTHTPAALLCQLRHLIFIYE
mgnify:CR=1 FL=1